MLRSAFEIPTTRSCPSRLRFLSTQERAGLGSVIQSGDSKPRSLGGFSLANAAKDLLRQMGVRG